MLMHIDQVINTSNYVSPHREQGRAGEKINGWVILRDTTHAYGTDCLPPELYIKTTQAPRFPIYSPIPLHEMHPSRNKIYRQEKKW